MPSPTISIGRRDPICEIDIEALADEVPHDAPIGQQIQNVGPFNESINQEQRSGLGWSPRPVVAQAYLEIADEADVPLARAVQILGVHAIQGNGCLGEII